MEWLHTYEENHKFTFHGAPRRSNGYIQWGVAWFPEEENKVSKSFQNSQNRVIFG